MNISIIVGLLATLACVAMFVRCLNRWIAGTERGVGGVFFLILWTLLTFLNASAALAALR